MLARIFINRPVLACVLSIVILLLGFIAYGLLPVAEYPEVTPPIVRVTAYYPGANAQVLVQNRVAIAEPSLPEVVRAIGVTTKKRAADILLAISLDSEVNPATGR